MNDDPTARTAVMTRSATLPEQARAFTIIDSDSYARVAEFLLGIKALRAEIAATFDEHIGRAYEAHRALCREKRDAEAAAVEAERIAKDLLVGWDLTQSRAREQEQAELDAIAREAVQEAMAEAIAHGDLVHVEALRAMPTPLAVVPPATPPVAGISYRETWSARVVNFAALVNAAVTHPAYLSLLKPDTRALDAQARSLRGRLAIPGVESVCTKDVAAARRR
jgi:hypothetical protein